MKYAALRLFTAEQEEFIRSNVKGIGNEEMTNMVNERFGLNITKKQMKRWKSNHHVSSGLTGRYEKGHVPNNKGKKMSKEQYGKCKRTMFRKGNIPHNHRPIGSERINVYGYTEVKVEEPNKWRPKHQVVWEREYGKIPKQHVIIFADGNKQNFDLDNLVCISRQELIRLNKNQMTLTNKEVTQAYIGIVKLQIAIADKKKRKKENRK